MGEVFEMFKAGEKFERQRAAAEGREPRLYHGVFSSHPSPDQRAVQAAKGAANIKDAPPEGWIERRDEYLTTINGIAYGSSRAQGIVRDNRFYHADMGITLAFPRGWTIENQRDRLLAFTPKKDARDADHDRREAREAGAARIPAVQVEGRVGPQGRSDNEHDGRRDTPSSPAAARRSTTAWARCVGPCIYRGQSAFIFAGASRSAMNGVPEVDGLFLSVGPDTARPQARGVSAGRALSHQGGEGHRQDATV